MRRIQGNWCFWKPQIKNSLPRLEFLISVHSKVISPTQIKLMVQKLWFLESLVLHMPLFFLICVTLGAEFKYIENVLLTSSNEIPRIKTHTLQLRIKDVILLIWQKIYCPLEKPTRNRLCSSTLDPFISNTNKYKSIHIKQLSRKNLLSFRKYHRNKILP
jgi:hypothetical protein